jgi:hypothetical protein
MGVVPPRHRQIDPSPLQKPPQVPHELADPGLPEELPRVVRVDSPMHGEVDGPLLIMLVVKGHQLPEGEAPSSCLGPDVLLGEAPVGQVQPGSSRHLAVTGT